MLHPATRRIAASLLSAAIAAVAHAGSAEAFDGQYRLLDTGSGALTLQPGALGYLDSAEFSAGLATRLDPAAPKQSFDFRAAGGSDGLAGGLLLRQDGQERWWTGYGVGLAAEGVSIGFSAQRSGLPLWSTEAERDGSRVDLGLTVRPTPWLAAGYNLGRSESGGGRSSADQRIGIALREPLGAWGLEGALLLDGGGGYAGSELGLGGRFGAFGVRLSGSVDEAASVAAGLFASYALDGATVGLGAAADAAGGSLTERVVFHGRNPVGADLGRSAHLVLKLSGPLEQRLAGSFFGATGRPFAELLEDVRRAADDPRVSGIYLALDGCSGGLAEASELRAAIASVRAAGKRVVAYLETATLVDLYLAGAADWVVASPTLQLLRTGVGGTSYYLADLLANAGIQAQFVRTGPHKSGPEVYLQQGPSDASRAQYEAYLEAVEQELVRGIGNEDPERMARWRTLALQPPVTAAGLQEAGLVQAVLYNDEVDAAFNEAFSEPLRKREVAPWREEEAPWRPGKAIAVLHIDGEIVDVAGGLDLLGGEPVATTSAIVEAAEALRDDESVAGVIVAIDSPGGSAWASDEMAHALSGLAAKKPVVVSMGSVAASGGYYVASLGVPIFATPTTLTGSIGVYAGTFSAEGLFSRVGIQPVRIERGGATDLLGPHTWSEAERAAIERSVEATYVRFLELVAKSRGLSVERVREIAGGRIYAGTAAKELGLVDELSGFEGARLHLLEQLGLDAETTPVTHLPSHSGELSLSAGLSMLAPKPHDGAAALGREVAKVLGIEPLISLARPMLTGAEGAPMMHFDGVVPRL